jgi:hypothetical protein
LGIIWPEIGAEHDALEQASKFCSDSVKPLLATGWYTPPLYAANRRPPPPAPNDTTVINFIFAANSDTYVRFDQSLADWFEGGDVESMTQHCILTYKYVLEMVSRPYSTFEISGD